MTPDCSGRRGALLAPSIGRDTSATSRTVAAITCAISWPTPSFDPRNLAAKHKLHVAMALRTESRSYVGNVKLEAPIHDKLRII